MSEVITFVARVIAIEEKFKQRWLGGIGHVAEFAHDSMGWYVSLEGSYEALFVGTTKPNIKLGDHAEIRITFNAKP